MSRIDAAGCLLWMTIALSGCGNPDERAAERDASDGVDPVAARAAATPGQILVEADRWHHVDRQVDTSGLDVRFPDADGRDEVMIWEGRPPYPPGGIGPTKAVRLSPQMRAYEISWRGVTFEVRASGTGAAEGAELTLGLESAPEDGRMAGKLEMEDPAGADEWIEIERARLLRAPDR